MLVAPGAAQLTPNAIGDRAFGRDPRTVMRNAVAFLQGLQEKNVLACGKHFPGHGDTSVDSHFDLPIITHDRARLEQIEIPPFRAASGSGIASMMTAHVVCESLDPGVPATLSRAICGSLLRAEIGFDDMNNALADGDLPRLERTLGKLLADAVFSHWDRAHRARMFTLRLRPKPVSSTKEHMALVERLRAGDAAGAAAVNREHRQRASRELLAIFERFRLQQM